MRSTELYSMFKNNTPIRNFYDLSVFFNSPKQPIRFLKISHALKFGQDPKLDSRRFFKDGR